MGRLAERLVTRLRSEHDLQLPSAVRLVRVYPSAAARNVGAWSWCLTAADGSPLNIGSQWPVGALIRSKRWDVGRDLLGDTHIDPQPAPTRAVF